MQPLIKIKNNHSIILQTRRIKIRPFNFNNKSMNITNSFRTYFNYQSIPLYDIVRVSVPSQITILQFFELNSIDFSIYRIYEICRILFSVIFFFKITKFSIRHLIYKICRRLFLYFSFKKIKNSFLQIL